MFIVTSCMPGYLSDIEPMDFEEYEDARECVKELAQDFLEAFEDAKIRRVIEQKGRYFAILIERPNCYRVIEAANFEESE